jgi:hypothetical protein
MSILDTIKSANDAALKAGDKQRRSALSFLLSALQAAHQSKKDKARSADVEPLTDAEVIGVLQKQKKQRQDTIRIIEEREDYIESNAVAQNRYEIAVIEEFLPAAPSEESVRAEVKAIIAQMGTVTLKDMGKIMGAAKAKLTGVDPAVLSMIVKCELSLVLPIS